MKYELVVRFDLTPQIDPSAGCWYRSGYRSGMATLSRYRPHMFRLVYRERFCRDCRERNQWPICECGYMRPLSDEFSVIEYGVRYRWTPAGAVPRLPFTRFELAQIRDAILERGARRGDWLDIDADDALPEHLAIFADGAEGEGDLLAVVIAVLTLA